MMVFIDLVKFGLRSHSTLSLIFNTPKKRSNNIVFSLNQITKKTEYSDSQMIWHYKYGSDSWATDLPQICAILAHLASASLTVLPGIWRCNRCCLLFSSRGYKYIDISLNLNHLKCDIKPKYWNVCRCGCCSKNWKTLKSSWVICSLSRDIEGIANSPYGMCACAFAIS